MLSSLSSYFDLPKGNAYPYTLTVTDTTEEIAISVNGKHAELLTVAGVAFLYFDVTNAFTYTHNALTLMGTLHDLNEQGFDAAVDSDATYILITGWNEWTVGNNAAAHNLAKHNDVYE